MTVDQAASAWESMLIDTNVTAPAVGPSSRPWSQLIVATRTAGLLILAILAILVLLPAVLAAQAAVTG